MSRIGKKPVTIDSGITVTITDGTAVFKGPKGEMAITIPPSVQIAVEGDQLKVAVSSEGDDPLKGLYRTLMQNAISGVKTGWTKTLEMVGVGYRAQTTGSELTLSLGYSHPVIVPATQGITFQVTENKITISGVNKQLVGEIAAGVRRLKPPESYKGKGIRYLGEHVRKKLGKAAKAVGGAPGAK